MSYSLPIMRRIIRLLLCAAVCLAPVICAAQQELQSLEEQAMRAAVRRVAGSVVQIQTVGGLEAVGRRLVGTGPSTGLIVSSEGLIVSSAYNFVQKPSSIVVTLPTGERLAARLVATDYSRMIVLLRVASDQPLPVPEPAPPDEIQVGAWAIAVGRTFDADRTNMSVGVVSALRRMFGKVIQTDAKISPRNYGGPLVDIRGRVLGVLVPMSPQGEDELAGVEWYDSGIGFAVPLTDIHRVLPRLAAGKDQHPGILGVSLKEGDPFSVVPEIAAVQPKSPAQEAGLKAGDRIVEVDGHKVDTQVHLRFQIAPRYAGEEVHVVVLRGDDRIERDIRLTDRLLPFEHAFLGVLPLRVAADAPSVGVPVRYVFPKSGAARAGIFAGDHIATLAGKAVHSPDEAITAIGTLNPGDKIAVGIRRGSSTFGVEVVVGQLPIAIASDLPLARSEREAFAGERPPLGIRPFKLAEFKNECTLYVPDAYDPNIAHGVVLWLHAAGDDESDTIVEQWKVICDQHDLIFVAPRSTDPSRWNRTDTEYLRKLLDSIAATYTVDRTRVVVHGQEAGGAMAYTVAWRNRELVRGVAVVNAPLPRKRSAPPNDPVHRLAIYSAKDAQAGSVARIDSGVSKLMEARYPVTVVNLSDETRYLNADELADLARWIDALDRF